MKTRQKGRGMIYCYDYQVMETLLDILSTQPHSLYLLATAFQSIPSHILIFLAPVYVTRSIRIDMAWSRRLWQLSVWADQVAFRAIYYSVLGGAYCSLGKANKRYAYKASELAIKQIGLARELKDSILECKCWLYFAEDLIQLKKFKKAAWIIARQKEWIDAMQDVVVSVLLKDVMCIDLMHSSSCQACFVLLVQN